MLKKIMKYYNVEPKDTLFVGDKESDKITAENAECNFEWAEIFFKV